MNANTSVNINPSHRCLYSREKYYFHCEKVNDRLDSESLFFIPPKVANHPRLSDDDDEDEVILIVHPSINQSTYPLNNQSINTFAALSTQVTMEDFLFPWESKKQKKQTTKTNSANNSNSNSNHRPSILPTPPPGQEWYQDKQTKEWKLIRSSLMTSDDNETPNNESSISTRSSLRVPPKSPASRTVILHNMPTDTSSRHHSNEEAEDDWDLVSENTDKNNKKPSITQPIGNNRVSASAAAGSVRSIDDISGAESVTSSVKRRLSEDDSSASVGLNPYHSTSNNNSSICSHTSSSIASSCQFLGPSGRGVLGVDYLEHVVLPTDTLPGICLAYKVHATKLRQANHFSGNSLLLAPKKLVIPISQKALKAGFLRVQDTDAKEYKLYSFLAEYSDFGVEEAKA